MQRIILEMSDEDAEIFLQDVRNYPNEPLLTPVQENEVQFNIVEVF